MALLLAVPAPSMGQTQDALDTAPTKSAQADISPGRIITRTAVAYPKDARKQKLQGTVVLDVTVGVDGRVSNIAVEAGDIVLAEAAIDAVQTWKFEPYTKNGEFANVNQRLEFKFGANKEEAEFSPNLAPAVEVEQAKRPTAAAPIQNASVYHVGHGITAPKVIYAPDPKYDKTARKERYQGVCVLSTIVEPDGLPHDVRVVRALGRGLDARAVEAVQKWKFEPAMKDGKPVAVFIHVEVTFRLY